MHGLSPTGGLRTKSSSRNEDRQVFYSSCVHSKFSTPPACTPSLPLLRACTPTLLVFVRAAVEHKLQTPATTHSSKPGDSRNMTHPRRRIVPAGFLKRTVTVTVPCNTHDTKMAHPLGRYSEPIFLQKTWGAHATKSASLEGYRRHVSIDGSLGVLFALSLSQLSRKKASNFVRGGVILRVIR